MSGFYRMILPLLLLAGTFIPLPAQEAPFAEMEQRLISGDKKTLTELCRYFDSDKKRIEYLGWHRIETTENAIARRIVRENCLFLPSEIRSIDSVSRKEFHEFLIANQDRIVYSDMADAFIITPFDRRTTAFEIRELDLYRLQELEKKRDSLLHFKWISESGIDQLLEAHAPEALLRIASLFVKGRNRFNRYQWNEKEYVALLQLLTHSRIGVPDENGKISFLVDQDFLPDSKINLLIFFAVHYKDYRWSEESNCFLAPSYLEVLPASAERAFMEKFNDKNDSVARHAFLQLCESDPSVVVPLADEYEEKHDWLNKNPSLPTFPYRFVKQLVQLTDYCRRHGVDYRGTPELHRLIDSLRTRPFSAAYQWENRAAGALTPSTVTAFEYNCLVREQSWAVTTSAGRVLDLFYSDNWEQITSDPASLALYLKKAHLFNNLGIIGVCNNYMNKFLYASDSVQARLGRLHSDDPDIQARVGKARELAAQKRKAELPAAKEWVGNKDQHISNPAKKIRQAVIDPKDSTVSENLYTDIVAQISYEQLPEVLQALATLHFQNNWKKFGFLKSDFGFFGIDFNDSTQYREFLAELMKGNESALYEYLLNKSGITVRPAGGQLDYDRMYTLLKYDVATAFAGGGGGKRDDNVYAVVKILEKQFGTTLGFPVKRCNSRGIYGCDCGDRADAWMRYLENNKLLKQPHGDPPSFREGDK